MTYQEFLEFYFYSTWMTVLIYLWPKVWQAIRWKLFAKDYHRNQRFEDIESELWTIKNKLKIK